MSKDLKEYSNIVAFIKNKILYNGEDDDYIEDENHNIKRSKISMDFILKCLEEYKKLYPEFLFDRELLNKLHNNSNIFNYFNEYVGVFGSESFDGDGWGYVLGYYNQLDNNDIEPHQDLSPDENLYRLILTLKNRD